MIGLHHQLDDCKFEQAPGVDDGQGSLARCSPWGRKELNTTELTDTFEKMRKFFFFFPEIYKLSRLYRQKKKQKIAACYICES